MTLPEIAVRRPVTTLMALISIVLLGGVALTRLPLAFMPDIVEPEFFVILPYESASPEQVEQMIVRPVEDALGGVKGLQTMWSRCGSDGGRIRLGFDWAWTCTWPRGGVGADRPHPQRASRRHGRHPGQPQLGHPRRRLAHPRGRLSSPLDLSESYDLIDRKIIRPLERVNGVAQVRLDGVNPREVRINLRLADLELHGVDVRDVSNACRAGNFDMSLGRIVTGDRRYTLRTIGSLSTVAQIRRPAPARPTACAYRTWPTSSIASPRWNTGVISTATSPWGDRVPGVRGQHGGGLRRPRGGHRRHEPRPRPGGRELPGLVQSGA